MPYCTECGGKLTWDRKLKHYTCQSCGLTFTETELSNSLDKLYTPKEDEDELKQRRHKEYLDWWFEKKSKKER